MSTSLTSINGIYRKVIANNEARLKYTYVAGITYPATKSLALFSIPFAATPSNTSMFGLVSSTDDATLINETFNGTLNDIQYEPNLLFDSLDKMMSRPNTTEFTVDQRFINEGEFNATSVAINDYIYFSVLFKADIAGFNEDIYIMCHEKANNLPVSAIKMTDSNVVSLGNNLYVTKLNSSFKIKNNNDGQALDNFPLPYFSIAHIETDINSGIDMYRRLNVDFKIHDIAICACLNQS